MKRMGTPVEIVKRIQKQLLTAIGLILIAERKPGAMFIFVCACIALASIIIAFNLYVMSIIIISIGAVESTDILGYMKYVAVFSTMMAVFSIATSHHLRDGKGLAYFDKNTAVVVFLTAILLFIVQYTLVPLEAILVHILDIDISQINQTAKMFWTGVIVIVNTYIGYFILFIVDKTIVSKTAYGTVYGKIERRVRQEGNSEK